MTINFDEKRWDRTQASYRAWWAGELKRPLICAKLDGYESDQKEPAIPSYEFTSFYDDSVTAIRRLGLTLGRAWRAAVTKK